MTREPSMERRPREEAQSVSATETVYWQRFEVPYDYPVYFTRDLFDVSNPVFASACLRLDHPRRHRLLAFIDQGVLTARPALTDALRAYLGATPALALVGEPIAVPGGEAAKRPEALAPMLEAIAHHGVDRHSFVVAIGGGAVLDAVGMVAAMAHRGIRHIRVPTTVLAQNDAGVGVKNGINLMGQKNFLGTFAPPFAVLNDVSMLSSLSPRDRRAGMAEAVKVALTRDADFFSWLEAHAEALLAFETSAVRTMIRRCAELHLDHIRLGGDPFERGSARPLDYGHWAAHHLEIATGHALRHGEAVSCGLVLDARYAELAGALAAGRAARIARLLTGLGLPVFHPALIEEERDGKLAILRGLEAFRQHLGGRLTVTLLQDIGRAVDVHHMDADLVREAAAWLATWGAADLRATCT